MIPPDFSSICVVFYCFWFSRRCAFFDYFLRQVIVIRCYVVLAFSGCPVDVALGSVAF